MTKPVSMTMTANIIGVTAILVTGGYMVYDWNASVEVKPCSPAYPPSIVLDLNSSAGEVLSAAQLQARSQSQDWGVMKKLKVERTESGPAPLVFDISLSAGDLTSSDHKFGGVGFPWRPNSMKNATAVCFSYNVWLPSDFDYSVGGILPGVASIQTISEDDEDDEDDEDELVRTFRAHPTWSKDGTINFLVFNPTSRQRTDKIHLTSKQQLTLGRWHKLEQEVVLNDPGKKNGTIRLWIDGEIAIDRQDLALRTGSQAEIQTALYHVSYGSPDGNNKVVPLKDAVIRLSPLELSWK